jgi:hypothetical protein
MTKTLISFFRRKKNPDAAPSWTSFSKLSEYEEFIGLVRKYFNRKNLPHSIEADALTVTGGDWPYEQMGLANLAQICKQSRRPEWKDIINAHFDTMQRVSGFETEFYAKAHDYSYAAPHLGVRIHPNEYLANIGEEATITRRVADDLSAMLVFDFPHGVCNCKPETTIQWNRTNEQLFDLGLANGRMKYSTEIIAEKIHGTKIWFIQGDHFFVANSALEQNLLSAPQARYGSLIGIPNRHVVLLYPIEDLGVIDALQPFVVVLRGLYKEGPGSISRSLYWHRNGQLTRLPYHHSEDELDFNPPAEFLLMMDRLPPRK